MDKAQLICVITLVLVLGLLLGYFMFDVNRSESFVDPKKMARADALLDWSQKNPKGSFSKFKKDTNGDIIEFELAKKPNATAANLSAML